MSGLVNVIIVAPSRLFREGLRLIVSSTRCAADSTSASFVEALTLLRAGTVPADVIVGDLVPDLGEEYRAISAIRREFPNVKIVGLTRTATAFDAERAVQHGVSALFSKDLPAEALRHALELVAMGGIVGPIAVSYSPPVEREAQCSGSAPARLVEAVPKDEAERPDGCNPTGLSNREEQTLKCLVDGMSNKLIARHLDVAEATVKVHLRSLLRKLKVQNRTQAAIWAMQNATAPARPASVPTPRLVSQRALPRLDVVAQSGLARAQA